MSIGDMHKTVFSIGLICFLGTYVKALDVKQRSPSIVLGWVKALVCDIVSNTPYTHNTLNMGAWAGLEIFAGQSTTVLSSQPSVLLIRIALQESSESQDLAASEALLDLSVWPLYILNSCATGCPKLVNF